MKVSIGGQNPLWDGAIASAALAAQGHAVVYDLHTIDHFSRDPSRKGVAPALSQESYLANGSYNRWTACLEHPTWLGRCSIAPVAFEKAGVDFGRIASFTGTTREKVIADLTAGDWFGVTLGEDERVAQGMRTVPLGGSAKQLAKMVITELRDAGACTQALGELAGLFSFNAPFSGPFGGRLWEDVGTSIASRLLAAFGGEFVEVTTSYDTVTGRMRPYSSVFASFVRNYAAARALYNEALSETEENVTPLDAGELPFYALVQEKDGLKRLPVCATHDRADAILAALEREHEVIAICGKAVMFMLELRELTPVAVVQHGSPYLPASRRFGQEAKGRLSGFPDLHGAFTVHLNALDALQHLGATIRLPAYLAAAVGVERISCRDLARHWRFYAERAQARADKLAAKDPMQILPHLRECGVTGAAVNDLVAPILAMNAAHHEAVKAAFADPDRPRRGVRKAEADDLYRAPFLKGLYRQAVAGLDLLRAEALRQELAVAKALTYWNSRPFALWVASLPGWASAVKNGTECVPE